jgi:hypothetical protein
MFENTAEAWSCCDSRTYCDMLRVWFSCSPFVDTSWRLLSNGLHQRQATYNSAFSCVRRNDRGRDPSTVSCQIWTEQIATMKHVRMEQNVQKQPNQCWCGQIRPSIHAHRRKNRACSSKVLGHYRQLRKLLHDWALMLLVLGANL